MIFSTTNRNRKHKIAADIGNIMIITTIVITVTDYSTVEIFPRLHPT